MQQFIKFLIVLCIFSSCNGQAKINGVSFVSASHPIDESHVMPLTNIHANYVTLMPFGFVKSLDETHIRYNESGQWFGETRKGIKQYNDILKKKGIKAMLKPQLWAARGEYTGFIKMTSETDWLAFEKSYLDFILVFAKLAQEENIPIFCIGTELEQFVMNRPQFWHQLIKEIRNVYKGQLTYAANWDEFKRIPFWKELDFIGIDAYFPVSNSKTPTVEECREGWQVHKEVIHTISKKYDKPVLFTEFGYRSVNFAGKEPWNSDRKLNEVNLEAQTNATQALFEEFWNEEWFKGGFIWKWFPEYDRSGGTENSRFTPQNKPSEMILKSYYSRYK